MVRNNSWVRHSSRLIAQVFATASHVDKGRLLHSIKMNAGIICKQDSSTYNNNKGFQKGTAHNRECSDSKSASSKSYCMQTHCSPFMCKVSKFQAVLLSSCGAHNQIFCLRLYTSTLFIAPELQLRWDESCVGNNCCIFWNPYERHYLYLVVRNVTLGL
jgi:hypothetical protein